MQRKKSQKCVVPVSYLQRVLSAAVDLLILIQGTTQMQTTERFTDKEGGDGPLGMVIECARERSEPLHELICCVGVSVGTLACLWIGKRGDGGWREEYLQDVHLFCFYFLQGS